MGGWLRRIGPAPGLLLACACGAGEEAEPVREEGPAPAVAEDSVPVAQSAPSTRIVYVEGEFPHGAHSGVACAACHGAMPGHVTHVATACTECHVAPEGAAALTPSPAECAACHHATDRPEPCAHCHAAPPAPPRAVATAFTVAGRPRGAERTITFDHVRHGAIACRTCHGAGATLGVERACVSCHADHHRPAADCAACHARFPLSAHDAAAHLGCDGAGCHREPAVFASPAARNVCLVCHRDQVDHEPGGECHECHLVGGAGP